MAVTAVKWFVLIRSDFTAMIINSYLGATHAPYFSVARELAR